MKSILAPMARFLSQDALLKWSKRKAIFPFYHTIHNEQLPYISNLYPVRSVKQFTDDLDYFCTYFRPIDVHEVTQRIEGDTLHSEPVFHLTFDDGLKELYTVVAPILEERKIPATFFINTDFIDNKDLFYRYKVSLLIEKCKPTKAALHKQFIEEELKRTKKWKGNVRQSLLALKYHDRDLIGNLANGVGLDFNAWLEENQPYLTSDQVHDLIRRGFSIGSHSKDHPRFKYLSMEEQRMQFLQSVGTLKEDYDLNQTYFSFPFSDEEVSASFFEWMYKEQGCTLSFGVSGLKDDVTPFHLHRLPMDECLTTTALFVKSEYVYFLLKAFFNKNKMVRT